MRFVEQIRLHDERWPWFSIITRHGDHDEIPAFQPVHPAVSRVSSIQVITLLSTRRFLAATRLWRRHSSANPRARVSGTHS